MNEFRDAAEAGNACSLAKQEEQQREGADGPLPASSLCRDNADGSYCRTGPAKAAGAKCHRPFTSIEQVFTSMTIEARLRMFSVLTIGVVIFGASCGSRLDKEKFDKVYRSGKALEAAVDDGVSLLSYRQLRQELATEVSIVIDRADGEQEKTLAVAYAAALKPFTDAQSVWAQKISSGSVRIGLSGRPEMERIAKEHEVPYPDAYLDADEAITLLWKRGKAELQRANALLLGS